MLQFTVHKDLDPNSASLRRLLEAHFTYARMSAAKSLFLHLLAVVSVAVWIAAMWPGVLPLRVLDSALALWVSLLFFAILTSIEEWLWHRKVTRYQSEQAAETKKDAQ
jgi:membrane protein implicated in regulation of membrane protease activity